MRTRTARRTVRVWPRTSRIVTVTVVLSVRTPRVRRRRSVALLTLSANVRRAGPAESRRVTRATRVAESPRRRAVARDTVIVAVARHATAQATVNVARPRVREAAIDAVGRERACVGAVPLPGTGCGAAGAGAAPPGGAAAGGAAAAGAGAPRTSNSDRSVKNSPGPPAAELLWFVSIVMRTNRTPAIVAAVGSVVILARSAAPKVCVMAGANVTPSLDPSTRRSCVAALASSPHVFDGSTANAVTFTACGRRTVAVGGAPWCGLGSSPGAPAVCALYADQPEPWLRSNAPSAPHPNGANTASFVAAGAAPPLSAAQSRRIVAFSAVVPPPATAIVRATNCS